MKAVVPGGFEIELGSHWLRAGEEKTAAEAATALVAAHQRLYAGQTEGRVVSGSEFDHQGFRVYLDHEHAEICSPLVLSAAHLVNVLRDARRIVARCTKTAEEGAGPLLVSYNNTSRQGAAWAFHLNLLVSRHAFDEWRDTEWHPLQQFWVPYLVTSLPLVGTGKVGGENGVPDSPFQLSQRADFIDQVVGLETVDSKSLINTRDEPLADPKKYARFHVIAFDTNLADYANWLKFGISQVLLALLEEGAPMPDLTLDDPIHAVRVVSRDLSFREPICLKTGHKETALTLQRRLAEAAAGEVQKGCAASAVPDAKLIIANWLETLDDLEGRKPRLVRRLDWCAKLSLLRRAQQTGQTDRQKMMLLDLQYAEVGGVFDKLERAGAIDRLEDFLPRKTLASLQVGPAPREQARAALVRRFRRHLATVYWHYAVGRDGAGNHWFIPMDDPLDGRDLLKVVRSAQTWRACLRRLIEMDLATQAVPVYVVTGEDGLGGQISSIEELSVQKEER